MTEEIQRPTERAHSTGRRLSLFVVDNDRDTTLTMCLLLRRYGHNVEAIYSGKDAIRALRSSTPDVVLLDIGMPEMDGYAVAEWIRQQPGLKDVRLIAVSGYDRPEHQERSKAAGCNHYLIKPINFETLRALLENL